MDLYLFKQDMKLRLFLFGQRDCKTKQMAFCNPIFISEADGARFRREMSRFDVDKTPKSNPHPRFVQFSDCLEIENLFFSLHVN